MKTHGYFLVPVSNLDLVDVDMHKVARYIIKPRKTHILDLSGNKITQLGAQILSKALRKDTVEMNNYC